MIAMLKNTQQFDSAQNLLLTAKNMKAEIAACSHEIESERRLPLSLVNKLKAAGFFRMTMPQEWGGLEVDPITQLQVIEILSEYNASVGWCVMIGSDTGYFSSFIDQAVAKKMFSNVDMITGSALTTIGRAEKTEQGYRVSGRLPFSSGCHHSDWFVLGCLVFDEGIQCFLPNGTPETRQCFVPASAVTILDTWDSIGLRGSGSNDLQITDYVVPKEQSFSFQTLTCHRPSPLYVFPMSILFNFSSVPLGIAQAAINYFTQGAARPTRMTVINGELTPPKNLRDESFVQDTVGRAAAKLHASRAYLYTTISDIWETLTARQEITPQQFSDFLMVHTHVYEECMEAVRLIYKISGGSAVYKRNELDRYLRDIVTVNQHVVNSFRAYGSGGRLLLGLPPEQILL